MSNKVLNAVLASKAGSNTTARFILTIMAHMANDDGYCYPMPRLLSKKANCSEITVYKALKRLSDEGSLLTVRTLGQGHKSEYIVLAGINKKRHGEVLKGYFEAASKEMLEAIEAKKPLRFFIK